MAILTRFVAAYVVTQFVVLLEACLFVDNALLQIFKWIGKCFAMLFDLRRFIGVRKLDT